MIVDYQNTLPLPVSLNEMVKSASSSFLTKRMEKYSFSSTHFHSPHWEGHSIISTVRVGKLSTTITLKVASSFGFVTTLTSPESVSILACEPQSNVTLQSSIPTRFILPLSHCACANIKNDIKTAVNSKCFMMLNFWQR